jgi:hypothetical protein
MTQNSRQRVKLSTLLNTELSNELPGNPAGQGNASETIASAGLGLLYAPTDRINAELYWAARIYGFRFPGR